MNEHPVRKHKIFPEEFPESWASDWGEDEYGLFMGFTYKGVRQDFRWIEPGTFLMGSPEDELGRASFGNYETQHEVMLSQGFWLADTTVTQDLWMIVMGENPSRFKGGTRPVEQVSWDDVQQFIKRMNGMKPELQLCLPSEAEWEYCCRAGTTTPFSFGEQIDSELVNFRGERSKHKNQRYRKETIKVKSLPPNAWGLYEMHGNVWEWCNDWLGDYMSSTERAPEKLRLGYRRVLRGGSWFNHITYCRSATRYASAQLRGDNGYGFRLARSHRAGQSSTG